jgi:hypothetical protein
MSARIARSSPPWRKAQRLPKPMTSGAKVEGRFGKQDFVYQPAADVYCCPASKTLKYRYTNVENGLTLRRYWTTTCPHISSVGPRTSKSSRHERRCCGASKIGRSSLWAQIRWPLRRRCRFDRLSCAGSSLLRSP